MKKIEVNKTWIPDRRELHDLIDNILDSGQLTNNGPYVKLIEATLREQLGCKHVFATGNGTIALHIALRALDISEGEVITTAFSFIATASSIIWERCTPVFVDINPTTLCLDHTKIEEKINAKTKAILAVHVFGNTGEIDKIEALAKQYNIPTIYDGAHAYGTTYKGKSIFEFGTISTLSMHSSKIVSSIEGGAIFTNDDQLAEKIFKIRYFGKNKENFEEILGINGKMNEFNAAFGLLSIKNFKSEVIERKKIDHLYRTKLASCRDFEFTMANKSTETNYSYFPLILKSEDEVHRIIEAGKKENIIIRRYWYPALNSIPFIKSNPKETPIAFSIANRIICLPIYKGLDESDIDRVISNLVSF